MKMKNKAQAAMEFLMTYGWAILIILIALGALFYLGVFTPKTQNTGSIEAPFTFLDMKFTAAAVGPPVVTQTADIRIGVGGAVSSLTPAGQSITITAANPACGTGCSVAWVTSVLGAENTLRITYPAAALTKGSKVSGQIAIPYDRIGGFTHTATLAYSGTVE